MPRRRRILRWLWTTALALLALAGGIAAFVHVASDRRLARDYALDVELPAPDPSLRDEGRHLAVSRGCADCQGGDGTKKTPNQPRAAR